MLKIVEYKFWGGEPLVWTAADRQDFVDQLAKRHPWGGVNEMSFREAVAFLREQRQAVAFYKMTADGGTVPFTC